MEDVSIMTRVRRGVKRSYVIASKEQGLKAMQSLTFQFMRNGTLGGKRLLGETRKERGAGWFEVGGHHSLRIALADTMKSAQSIGQASSAWATLWFRS